MTILACRLFFGAILNCQKVCSISQSHFQYHLLFSIKNVTKLCSRFHRTQITQRNGLSKVAPQSTYMSLRPIQFVLVDNYIKDPDSFFNCLNLLPDSSKNVVASSTSLLKHIDDIKNNEYNKTISDLHIDELLEDIDLEMFYENVSSATDNEAAKKCSDTTSSMSTEANVKLAKRVKSNFIIEDEGKTSEEWQVCIDELHVVCKDYSIPILFKSLIAFFIDVTKLKNVTDPTLKSWHNSSLVSSFINFLIESDKNLKVAQPSLIIYLNYCIENNDFETFLSIYNRIKPRIPVYGNDFLHTLIKGLSFNGHLDEAKTLLKVLNLYRDKELIGQHRGLTTFAVGCFKSGEPSIAINIALQLMQQKGVAISVLVEAFLAFFSYTDDAEKWKENHEVVESFFNWLHANDVSLTSEAIEHIAAWFESIKCEKWKFATFPSYRIKRGKCPITGQKLKQCNLLQNEFNYLEKSVSKLLLQSSMEDINLQYFKQDLASTKDAPLQLFHRSSMKDVRAFLEYLHNEGPFDLIIDGMNFAYTLHPYADQKYFGKHRHKRAFRDMARVISAYTKAQSIEQKYVCIIFRKHLYDDVKVDGNFLFDIANVYFAGTGIADDVLILYGSVVSGPQCYFASHDLFRNYRTIVAKNGDRRLLSLFDRYQSSRQIFCKGKGNKLCLTRGVSYEPEIQRTDTTWHFPYLSSENRKSAGASSKLPRSWLCLSKTMQV